MQDFSPLSLVREIVGQTKIEELYELSLTLTYKSAKAGYITRMITLINDYILDRMLTLL
ncbi:hypothetical protein DFAR_3000011 [Desulfarculales bacterium]